MAQAALQLDQEPFSCSVCLELLRDPVTIPCGHSYCRTCIEAHWDRNRDQLPSCPQCKQVFVLRPGLVLAALVDQLKEAGIQAAAADPGYAGAEDVACDWCFGRKLKAVKSCLQCLASFCHTHLQPHTESPTFGKHKLVEPSRRLQENFCSRHDEVMKIFCRSDQQIICYLCSMEEHKGHDTVTAAAERTERQRELEGSRHNIQQRIQDRQKELKLLQQEVVDISRSADKTVEDSQEIFTQLISVMEQRRRAVEQQVRSQQEAEVSRVKELEEKLEQEIRELKRKDAELKKLSDTEDHSQFLQDYPSLSGLSGSTHSSSIKIRPLRHFEDVTAAVSKLRDQLQELLTDTWTNISLAVTNVDVLLLKPEPTSRAGFLRCSSGITLDPNTANRQLLLSEENRRATLTRQRRSDPGHQDQFTVYWQALSAERLTGRSYWEVEWTGTKVDVAVAYEGLSRAGGSTACAFGLNNKSWMLQCCKDGYSFWHNGVDTPVLGSRSSRVGVYLDHSAGILSFYRVAATITLLHRVQTTFTQPLHAGLRLYSGATAEFCQLK